MADRLLVFSDPRVRELLTENFIPVTGNDWYQRRRQDKEGEFFRSVAGQGPRKGEGGATRQGHYIFTAAGKLLSYNNNRGVDKRLEMIREGLEKWKALGPAEKKADIPERVETDPDFHRALPEGGRVLKVHTRALPDGPAILKPPVSGDGASLAAFDHLWLQENEIAELRALLESGGGPLPEWFCLRLARFHLVDNTRGEPPFWEKEEVKKAVFSVTRGGNIEGSFHLETKDEQRGFQGEVKGRLEFDEKGGISNFELLATGRHWGDGPYTKGARPGKSPLGIFLSLSPGESPADLIPPQAFTWEKGYWEPTR